MAEEVRAFQVTIPAQTAIGSGFSAPMAMPSREVDRIEIRVPPGPRGEMGFAIGAGGVPILPYVLGTYIVTDDEVINWPLEHQIDSGAWQLFGYNTGSYPHTVYVRYLVDVPQRASAGGPLVPISPADLEGGGDQLAGGPPLPPLSPLPPLPGLPPLPLLPPLPSLPGLGPAPAAPPDLVNAEEEPMLLSLYAGYLHLFFVDAAGALRHLYAPPGGFPPPNTWADDKTLPTLTLVPRSDLVGAQFSGQQHVFARRPDGGTVHIFQSLTGSPDWSWSQESLG